MKIKLTEEQYNRLLVENDKDFLDGQVNFKHIGNKVSPFIVKLFNIINEKCKDCPWDQVVGIIKIIILKHKKDLLDIWCS